MNKNPTENEQWKLLVLNLKEKAILKFGTGYQKILAEKTGFKKPNISRMFGLKYAPNLKNYTILMEAINLIDENYLEENSNSKFLVCLDKNTDEMYILHREDPCYLVHVKQETPLRFILIESYNDNWQDERLLLHPSINELKRFATNLINNSFTDLN